MNRATTPQPTADACVFAQLLSSTLRGARLARLLAVEQLRGWQVSPCVMRRAEQIVAELAANAVRHGRVRGRDFRLELELVPESSRLRIEVADARGECLPPKSPALPCPDADGESGRGLFLVAAFADRWGTADRPPGGKTVWAEIDGPGEVPEVVAH